MILGHAGVALSAERALYPANSEASINYALNAFNADGVELDVQMTQDSVLVLYHDENITLQNGENTCFYQLTWRDIEFFNTQLNHPILALKDVATDILERNKYLYLDLKFYDFCDSSNINLEVMAAELMETFEDVDSAQKSRLIFNSRNIYLIDLIPEELGIRSFETDKIQLAIDYYEAGRMDLLSTHLFGFNETSKMNIQNASLPFSLFSIKTRHEIEEAAGFVPDFVITDNIPATRKFYN